MTSLPRSPAALLDALVDRCRATRDPRLTPLLLQLGAAVAPPPPPRPDTSKARAAALAESFDGSALHVSATLNEVEAFAQRLETTHMLSMLGPIVSAWEIHLVDPRLATAALGLLTRHSKTLPRTVITGLLEALFRHADDSHPIDAYIEKRDRWPYENSLRIRQKRAKKARKVTPVADDELRALTTAVAARSKKTSGAAPAKTSKAAAQSEDQLVAAVVAAPDDDAPRAAYASWLTRQKRPLGALISLQLEAARRKLSATERAEEKRLLTECRPEFTRQFGGKPYSIHIPSMKVARGFVVSARVRDPLVPVAALLEQADLEDADLVGIPRLTCLEEVVAGSIDKAAGIVAGAPKLRQIVVSADVSNHREEPLSKFVKAVKAIPRAVERIGVNGSFVDDRDEAVSALLSSRFVDGCRVLSLGSISVPLGPSLLERVPESVERLVFRTSHGYPMLCFGLERAAGEVTAMHVFWEGRFVSDPAPVVSHLEAQLRDTQVASFTWSAAARNVEVFTRALGQLRGVRVAERDLTPEGFSESVLSLAER